jgi:triosephosphate isomerase (TIM)
MEKTRRPLIAANWKMHKSSAEALDFLDVFLTETHEERVDVVICPAFTSLESVSSRLNGTRVQAGAQDLYWEAKGAFTGEVAPSMLTAAGASWVIVGHSERRKLFGEKDQEVGLKAVAAFAAGLTPIICVGETILERRAGGTGEVVNRQLSAALMGLTKEQGKRLVVAYEPVWAIGSGVAAAPGDAVQVALLIRQIIDERFGDCAGSCARVQYGGSVKADNIAEFMASPEIDGALVGGAGLEPSGFAALVNNALTKREKK